jgi:hypothetical protein
MDLEQVYEAIGTDPVIETFWETNTSNQLVPVNTAQTVLLPTVQLGADYNATPIISGTATFWGDISVLGNGPLNGKIYTTSSLGDIYTASSNGGNIYTTNGYISAGGASGFISATGSISAGGSISTSSGNVYTSSGNVYTTNGYISAGGAYGYVSSTGDVYSSGGDVYSSIGNVYTKNGYIKAQGANGYISANTNLSCGQSITVGADANISRNIYCQKIECGGITIKDQYGTRIITAQPGSHTITHYTNILEYDPSKIGCFCEGTGELADVYDSDDGTVYTPTLDRACDAIVKVKPSIGLNTRILGVIVSSDTMTSHGDCLCVVKHDHYNIGDLLIPGADGVCIRSTDDKDKLYIMLNGLPRVRVTGIIPNQDFVLAFIS